MGTAETVLDYLRALAWPAVTVTALVLFRRSIRSILARVSQVEGFGMRASLDRDMEEAQRVTGSPTTARPRTGLDPNDLHAFALREYNDLRAPATHFREGRIVLADLSQGLGAGRKEDDRLPRRGNVRRPRDDRALGTIGCSC